MTKNQTNNQNQNPHKGRTENALVLQSDPELTHFIVEILARKGILANLVADHKNAVEFLDKNDCDIVFISEMSDPAQTTAQQQQATIDLVHMIRHNTPEMPVIMILQQRKQKQHRDSIDMTVRAVQAGCVDCLVKPIQQKRISDILDACLPNHDVQNFDSAEQGTATLYEIIGRSAKLRQTVELAKKIAPTSAPVLISGESGTGKELIAYLVHHNSKRNQGPYVRVNCAALSDTLLESELFGHEKGAFTGAYNQRKGRFETAHGGTLLLDEITETPIKFQAKLLRVLEQQDFERVGGNDNIRVNVRIISTTNKDMTREVAEGRFRQDLYYRLSGLRLIIAPLRERTDDLVDLVWHFVNLYARQTQRRITKLDPAMMKIFARYPWAGNVRQLRNVVLTSLILGVGQTLSLADVSWLFDELQPRPQEGAASQGATTTRMQVSTLAGRPLVQIEQQAIIETLRQTAGNQTKAAKVLGISDRTLRDKIRRYQKQESLQPA